jgi:lysozyme
MKNKIVIALVVIAAIVLYLKRKSIMTYYDILSTFLPGEESFSSKPYLDYKQYSWGYGTKVPSKYMGANGKPLAGITITRSQAFADMMVHINADKDYLSKLVKIDLTSSQWAALLSFSYNLGAGNADNLVPNINARKWAALKTQWAAYNKAGGMVNSDLVARRAKEWELFSHDLN